MNTSSKRTDETSGFHAKSFGILSKKKRLKTLYKLFRRVYMSIVCVLSILKITIVQSILSRPTSEYFIEINLQSM